MQVTARVDYALRAMLAVAEAEGPTSTVALAEDLDVSYHYLLSIVGELRRAGLLRVRRGASGGLMLAGPSSEITLRDVVVAVDGPLVLPDHAATESRSVYLRTLWLSAHEAMLDVFAQVPLAQARVAMAVADRDAG
jgi:Rrf2 family protein